MEAAGLLGAVVAKGGLATVASIAAPVAIICVAGYVLVKISEEEKRQRRQNTPKPQKKPKPDRKHEEKEKVIGRAVDVYSTSRDVARVALRLRKNESDSSSSSSSDEEDEIITILSYNINNLKNKINLRPFFFFINTYDVFILIETHVLEMNSLEYRAYFPGHELVFLTATRTPGGRPGRASGGIIIGCKRTLILRDRKAFFEDILFEGESYPILNIVLDFQIFKLIPVYFRPNDWDEDFVRIANLFSSRPNLWLNGRSILMGDMNVRIGDLQTLSGPSRWSQDETINRKGKDLIAFLGNLHAGSGYFVLNGTGFNDRHGNVTYETYRGHAVNDICAVSTSLCRRIADFEVRSDIQWSDHYPIVLKLISNTKKKGH